MTGKARARFRGLAGLWGPVWGLLAVWLLFAWQVGSTFMTADNTQVMLLQTSVVGTAALGATIVIISGGIDLSVGSVIAFTTVAVALLLRAEIPVDGGGSQRLVDAYPVAWPLVAAAGGVMAGALCGLAVGAMVVGRLPWIAAATAAGVVAYAARGGGWMVSAAAAAVAAAVAWFCRRWLKQRVPLGAFIVTLGMLGLVRGLAEGLADQQMVTAPRTWMNALMSLPDDSRILLPPGVIIMLVLAVLTALVLTRTRFGRHVFAIGSNEMTARLCGVPVERTKVQAYGLALALAGVAGLLQFSYLRMGDPTTAPGYELNVIAAVVIGGGSLAGGQGSIVGTLMGALIMTVVANGCNKMNISPWVQKMVTGAIIIGAVALDRIRLGRGERS